MAHVRLMVMAGSARAGSFNKRLARLAAVMAVEAGLEATFVDLADFPMPLYDGDDEATAGPPPNARKLLDTMMAHHGVLIVCPEYNASITPLLKNTLDWISRLRIEGQAPNAVYRTRVFALASASPGGFGGLRGLTAVRSVLEIGLGAIVLPEQFALPKANEAFGPDDRLVDKAVEKRLAEHIARLAHVAAALKA
ncbi:MAG: NAD(P)H-dependent oxidoreductase [Hyphomicrobiaceae bacterium]|nr:NAD(P)H-dependent oxidoreductase [Hyphomicrobiaceae bacterium]